VAMVWPTYSPRQNATKDLFQSAFVQYRIQACLPRTSSVLGRNRGPPTRFDSLGCGMGVQEGIHFVAELVSYTRDVARTIESETPQKLQSLLVLFAMLFVHGENDGLDDSAWAGLEVFVLVVVLITTASIIARVAHLQ
jgi:hypothetical protein